MSINTLTLAGIVALEHLYTYLETRHIQTWLVVFSLWVKKNFTCYKLLFKNQGIYNGLIAGSSCGDFHK